MTGFLALLRGINVGGHRKIRMADLRAEMTALGYADVQTYIQSGNVLFDSDETEAAVHERQIEDRIRQAFGLQVPVMVRTADEFVTIVMAEPFGVATQHPDATVYIGFLQQPAAVGGTDELAAYQGLADTLFVTGKHIFWLRRRDLVDGTITLDRVEKALKTQATFRNRATLRKLIAKHLA